MSGNEAWRSAGTVLCVRLDGIGDVLMTTPALRALKESCPGRRIIFLTSSAGAGIACLIPEIDEVLVYEAPWMKATPQRGGNGEDNAIIEKIRASGAEASVVFTVYSQNPLPAAFLCYLADVPLRLAYCRENPYQLLTDWVPEIEPQQMLRHEVARQLDLAASVGARTNDRGLSLRVPREAMKSVRALLREKDIRQERPVVVIHPGATAPSRRYPAESFAELGRYLVRGMGMQVLFTGTEPERALVTGIQSSMDAASTSLAGCLTLAELAALLSRAALLVSNNTGPAHIAAALGTPVVSLYALTNPQHIPWNVPSRVLYHDVSCKYCYKSICPHEHNDCLRLLSPREVVSAVSDLFRETEPVRRARRL